MSMGRNVLGAKCEGAKYPGAKCEGAKCHVTVPLLNKNFWRLFHSSHFPSKGWVDQFLSFSSQIV